MEANDANDNEAINLDPNNATSPSQLEEVTFDQENNSVYSPGFRCTLLNNRGCSIKELEEQLSHLRKENFNLKLRIYFLEERMGSNFNLDQESAIKRNIELSVEVESLRKEIDEKQDLLCQAVKALDFEDEDHRKQLDSKSKELTNLQEQMDGLQHQYDLLQEIRSQADFNDLMGSAANMQDDPQETITHMETRIADLEVQLRLAQQASPTHQITVDQLHTQLQEQNDKLQEANSELEERCSAIEELQSKIEGLEFELDTRQTEVDKIGRRMDQKETELKDLHASLVELKKTCDERNEMYEAECKRNERNHIAIANRNSKISELENSIEKYKMQMCTLEVQLETAVNEVKMRGTPSHADFSPASKALIGKTAQLAAAASLKASLNASGDDIGNAVDANAMREEIGKLKMKTGKLEQEQMKACRIIQTMLEKRKKNEKVIEDLRNMVEKRDALIKELRAKSSDGRGNQERVPELNLTAATPSTDTEHVVDERSDTNRLLEKYRLYTNDLEQQKQILMDTLKEKDVFLEDMEAKYDEVVKQLREKETRIKALECELHNVHENDSMSSIREKADVGTEKVSFWIKESEEKDREIERLEKEVAKRTNDLQSVVNTELWQKNREIERLQKYVTNCEKKDSEIAKLQLDLSMALKMNSSGSHQDDGTTMNALSLQVDLKTKELQMVQTKLQTIDEQRVEAQQACLILGTRLEELAAFLNNLLKQKLVLGLLGLKQNKWIRQRVDESLDLSKSLSSSLQFNPEQSLMQLTNISDILNNTTRASADFSVDLRRTENSFSVQPQDVSLTYQRQFNKDVPLKDDQSEVIRVLRLQIEELKGEIELRDNELVQRASSHEGTHQDLVGQFIKLNEMRERKNVDHSDSESWSEPDRSVSKARIGLDEQNLKPKMKTSESTEADARAMPRTPSKKSLNSHECRSMISMFNEQMSKYEQLIRDKDDLLEQASEQNSELSERYTDVVKSYEEICRKCSCIEARLEELLDQHKSLGEMYRTLQSEHGEEKIRCDELRTENESFLCKVAALEKSFAVAQDARTSAENEIMVLQGKVENLENYKIMLAESTDAKTKCIQNCLNALEIEKTGAQQETKAAEDKLAAALEEIALLNDKLLSLEATHAKSAANLINEAEQKVDRRMHELELQYAERKLHIERIAQTDVQKVREEYEDKIMKYERDYVEKAQVYNLKMMIKELEPLQEVLRISEQKVKQLESSETVLKQQLHDCEHSLMNKVSKLRQDLDASTLHCSQLQLDKTKTEDDKAQLQIQLRQYNEREDMFESQVNDLKKDFGQLKDNFKRQLSVLESEKTYLKMKLTSTETMNNELQEHVMKLQTIREPFKSQSAPTSPILKLYLTKKNMSADAGDIALNYNTSDEFPKMPCHQPDVRAVDSDDAERMRATSSPDLGIESDQGRFSSLEPPLSNNPPSGPSISITAAINEAIDRNQRIRIATECNSDSCIKVVSEMTSENHFLKKKLQKSNKLLEDTLSELAKANRRKREVEKNIFKQIHKTSQVLKMAKANLDSGSETEAVRKETHPITQ